MLTKKVGLILLGIAVMSGTASAAPLSIGGTLTPTPIETDPVGGGLNLVISSGAVPFTSIANALDFTGTLTTNVYNNDVNNPFGLNGLTFVYVLHNDATSNNAFGEISLGSFAGFLSDASQQAGPGVLSNQVARPSADDIHFVFGAAPNGSTVIGPGQTSTLLVIQTNALAPAGGSAFVIDHDVAMVATYIPSAGSGSTPEPASLALLSAGGAGLLIRRRRGR